MRYHGTGIFLPLSNKGYGGLVFVWSLARASSLSSLASSCRDRATISSVCVSLISGLATSRAERRAENWIARLARDRLPEFSLSDITVHDRIFIVIHIRSGKIFTQNFHHHYPRCQI